MTSLGRKNKLLTCDSLQQHQAVVMQMRWKLCLAYNEEMEDKGIVWYDGDIPSDLWVIGNARMLNNMSNAVGGLPISIDPTFNHGAFEVTPVTYRHQLIESRSKNYPNQWVKATVVGPTIIHHEKTEETFDTACRVIARKTGLMNKKVGIVTDGETALINACANNFMSSIGLRCTSHFKTNCKDFLKSVGISSDSEQAAFLDLVFGETGLIEANDKHELKKQLKQSTKLLDEMQRSLNDSEMDKDMFSSYLQEREKPVLRKLIRDARKNGGMPLNEEGVPQRVYTHQSETVNSILSAKNAALGYLKKKIFLK